MQVITYNCRGLISDLKKQYIGALLQKCDILLIQEHWLLNKSCNDLQGHYTDHYVFAKSGMIETELLIGRPYGGCGILISRKLQCISVQLECDSYRMCAVLSDFNTFTVMFISIYMPGEATFTPIEYNNILSIIEALQVKHDPVYIICGGDYNTDFSRVRSLHTCALIDFCNDNYLVCTGILGGSIDHTYHSDMNGITSIIDHIIISSSLMSTIKEYYVIDDIDNNSDHLPLLMTLDLSITKLTVLNERQFKSRPKWETATADMIKTYQSKLNMFLMCMPISPEIIECTDSFCKLHYGNIDVLYNHVINSCARAGQLAIPFTDPTQSNFKQSIVGWNESVKPFQNEAMHWNLIWKLSRRPRFGFVAEMRKSTRREYHKKRKYIVRRQNGLRKHRVATSFLSSNKRNFWKEISKIRGRSKRIASIIEGCSDNISIADCFAHKYKQLFNSVHVPNDMCHLYNNVCYDLSMYKHKQVDLGRIIPFIHVKHSINGMKSGKSDGFEGLTSDYLKNGTPLLFEYLSVLFSCMITHNYTPTSYGISTIVPIHKGSNLKMSETKNYRAIALSSILSKVLDKCITIIQASCLRSDPLQFAYKAKSSTLMCTSTIIEIINHYICGGGSIYMCMLDASKAFDRVDHYTLFKKLRVRNMCPMILRFLMQSYVNQTLRVNWNGSHSAMFQPSNGVKQGGVLSPVLFNVYLDDLIEELRCSGVGCHINNDFVGCFIYADDITLLAPSSEALNSMLGICSDYAQSHSILFNPSKTKCMFFDKDQSVLFDKDIHFMGKRIEFVDKCKLIGTIITRNILVRDMTSTINTFNRKCNELNMDFAQLSSDIRSKLMSSYCLDVYGSQLWNYGDDYVKKFYVAWRKAVRKIWDIPYKTHCTFLHVINETKPIDIMLENRCIKFVWSCINSKNTIVRSVMYSAMGNRASAMGENYRYFSYKYNITPVIWHSSYNKVKNCIDNYVLDNIDNPHYGYFIRELCISRDSADELILTSREMSQLVEYICTI